MQFSQKTPLPYPIFIIDFHFKLQMQKMQNSWAVQLEEKIEKYETFGSSVNGNHGEKKGPFL